jgi:hypothetical protein
MRPWGSSERRSCRAEQWRKMRRGDGCRGGRWALGDLKQEGLDEWSSPLMRRELEIGGMRMLSVDSGGRRRVA